MKDVIGDLGIDLDDNQLNEIVNDAKNKKDDKSNEKKDGEDPK